MATATSSPAADDNRTPKRQKGDEARPPPSQQQQQQQHPSQMYPPGYMPMNGGYMGANGSAGMPPGYHHGPPPPHHPHAPPPPPPHGAGMYNGSGGMYGGPPPPRGHGSPDRRGWANSAGGPPYHRGGPPTKEDKDGQHRHHPPHAHYPPPPHGAGGGWGHHPQSWQQQAHQHGPPYGAPPPGYPGGAGMYNGGWSGNSPPGPPANSSASNNNASGSSNKSSNHGIDPRTPGRGGSNSPLRNRPRPDSMTPTRQPPQSPSVPGPPDRPPSSSLPNNPSVSQAPVPHRMESSSNNNNNNNHMMSSNNSVFCMDVGSGRASVTHDMMDEGSSVSGSTKDKARGSYKCGRCGVPKKGHICPYQPKMKRRPDEPPPETRNAAVQVEMDEFMTLRRLNIRIQGFPESYATEPFMGANMVGAESRPPADPFLSSDGMILDPNNPHHQGPPEQHLGTQPSHEDPHGMIMIHGTDEINAPPPPPPQELDDNDDPSADALVGNSSMNNVATGVKTKDAATGDDAPLEDLNSALDKKHVQENEGMHKTDPMETDRDVTAKEEKTEAMTMAV